MSVERSLESKYWPIDSLDIPDTTQLTYYVKNNATPEVLTLVRLSSKHFGTCCEKLLRTILRLSARTSVQNDASLNGLKVEIKTARYWSQCDDCCTCRCVIRFHWLETVDYYKIAAYAIDRNKNSY